MKKASGDDNFFVLNEPLCMRDSDAHEQFSVFPFLRSQDGRVASTRRGQVSTLPHHRACILAIEYRRIYGIIEVDAAHPV